MLLELLSHQNLADQRYGFDPRFRFHVSRAVYKGILRYLATASGTDYVVQLCRYHIWPWHPAAERVSAHMGTGKPIHLNPPLIPPHTGEHAHR